MSEKRSPSRAEAVRMRRRQQSQKRVLTSSQHIARPLPAITWRGDTGYAPLQPAKGSKTRRRYQAAFSLPGIQIQMPAISLPRFEAGWRLLSFSLLLLLGTALYFAWTLPMFRVTAAQVLGNQRIQAEQIDSALEIAGQPIFTLVPAEMEKRLRLNYPEIASATVTVALPNVVSVAVAERQPVISWQQNGAYTWIDANGVAFRPRGVQAGDKLISVNALAPAPHGQPSANDAFAPAPYISEDLVQAIQILAPKVPSGSMLTYDPRYGLGWSDSRGWQAYFGSDAKDMAVRLQVYQALVNSLLQRGIYPVLISVQYPNAPYYRLGQ
ncbi:MAG TPA: FtsQ-type POTRA domain-containing protein [Anaerolineales bacterium]|nr:FtsQ-type POTRA domain-containing protein [Anaerolineales bacterium]